jgi:hypothetical protein
MDYTQDLIVDPIFDFVSFYDQQLLTDCEIQIPGPAGSDSVSVIRGHRAVLANGSRTFYNMFTAGMVEAETGVVKDLKNPQNLLPAVIRFLYSGKLRFTDDMVMSLLTISIHCQMDVLTGLLADYIAGPECSNPNSVLKFVNQCYTYELAEALEFLEPLIARVYFEIPMEVLTRALDVVTFAHVLNKVPGKLLDKVCAVNAFLGDWECNLEEKIALSRLFGVPDREVERELEKVKGRWWIPGR